MAPITAMLIINQVFQDQNTKLFSNVRNRYSFQSLTIPWAKAVA